MQLNKKLALAKYEKFAKILVDLKSYLRAITMKKNYQNKQTLYMEIRINFVSDEIKFL